MDNFTIYWCFQQKHVQYLSSLSSWLMAQQRLPSNHIHSSSSQPLIVLFSNISMSSQPSPRSPGSRHLCITTSVWRQKDKDHLHQNEDFPNLGTWTKWMIWVSAWGFQKNQKNPLGYLEMKCHSHSIYWFSIIKQEHVWMSKFSPSRKWHILPKHKLGQSSSKQSNGGRQK